MRSDPSVKPRSPGDRANSSGAARSVWRKISAPKRLRLTVCLTVSGAIGNLFRARPLRCRGRGDKPARRRIPTLRRGKVARIRPGRSRPSLKPDRVSSSTPERALIRGRTPQWPADHPCCSERPPSVSLCERLSRELMMAPQNRSFSPCVVPFARTDFIQIRRGRFRRIGFGWSTHGASLRARRLAD